MRHLGKRAGVILALTLVAIVASPPAGAEDEDPGKVVAAWIAAIRDGGRVHPGGRQRATLERRGAELLPHLIEGFADEDTRVGHTLARLAALAPEDIAIKLLGQALTDERAFVQEFAGVALGHLGSPGAVPLLTTAFRQGRLSLDTMRAALSRIGGEPAMDSLIGLLSSYKPVTREGAADSLRGFRHPRVATALVKALKDRIPAVRKATLEALGETGGPEHAVAVLPILKSKDAVLRLAAVTALSALGGTEARDALVRHVSRDREETLLALEGAVALGAGLTEAAVARAVRLLEEDDPVIRARAAGVLADHAESHELLVSALAKEEDADAAMRMGRIVARHPAKDGLAGLRKLVERFPDRRRETLSILDRAGDPELADRLRAIEPDPAAPPGGPLFLLALRSPVDPKDLTRALEIARAHPRSPGLLADAYLLAAARGAEGLEMLAKLLSRLPPEDLVEVPDAPTEPAIRALHMRVFRALTGRAFGHDPERSDRENRNALRRALKWWLANRKTPKGWSAGAAEDVAKLLESKYEGVREGALRMLAALRRWDDIARLMTSDPSPTVRVRAARFLVEAKDPRGVEWLCGNMADEGLVDWSPFTGSPRPTRREAARALWRAANRRGEYDGGPVDRDTGGDFVMEEQRFWTIWWSEHGTEGFDAWFRDGCARSGIDGPEDARTLARALAGDHPRYLKENLLDRLRSITERRVLPVDIPDLEVLAPGEDHPIFEALSHRWLATLK